MTRSDVSIEKKEPDSKTSIHHVEESSQPKASSDVDVGGSILLIIYFVLAAADAFTSSSDTKETLLGISAIVAGIVLLLRRRIPAILTFKVSLILYLLVYGQGYRLTNDFPVFFYVAGIAAVMAGITLALTIRDPRKPAFYSSIAVALFLFLVGLYELLTNIAYSSFTTTLDTLILLTSIIASILLWRDL